MTTLKNKKGVSLVELIAVIVIMGIIATVGGISVATIIENSNKSAAATAVSDVFAAGKNWLQSNPDETEVTLEELVTAGYIEAATSNKFKNGETLRVITISVSGTTYKIVETAEGSKENQIVLGKYTVTYADGKFTAA